MKAEEIRKWGDETGRLDSVSATITIQAILEVAAQLAELNERLAKWDGRFVSPVDGEVKATGLVVLTHPIA